MKSSFSFRAHGARDAGPSKAVAATRKQKEASPIFPSHSRTTNVAKTRAEIRSGIRWSTRHNELRQRRVGTMQAKHQGTVGAYTAGRGSSKPLRGSSPTLTPSGAASSSAQAV
ncbi:MAG: hypothetical protein ACREA4_07010 [Nitrososphaera sp.]